MHSTYNDLKQLSTEFFKKYNIIEAGIYYQWSELWDIRFNLAPIPHYNKRGCYAFFDNDANLLYIGVGASFSKSIYNSNGIDRRFLTYVDKSKSLNGLYIMNEKWNSVVFLTTIAFKTSNNDKQFDDSYLAYALEQYLIRYLSPPKNSTGKWI